MGGVKKHEVCKKDWYDFLCAVFYKFCVFEKSPLRSDPGS